MPKHWIYLAIVPWLALSACTAAAPFAEAAPDVQPPGATPPDPSLPPTAVELSSPRQTSPPGTPDATPILPSPTNTPVPFDGGDGFETTLVQSIALDQPQTATLLGSHEAHNWLFDGAAGQTITVRVEAAPGAATDPRLKLIDPGGVILAENDDPGLGTAAPPAPAPDGAAAFPDRNALLTFTLPADGTYTLRVDVYSPGDYVITVSEG